MQKGNRMVQTHLSLFLPYQVQVKTLKITQQDPKR